MYLSKHLQNNDTDLDPFQPNVKKNYSFPENFKIMSKMYWKILYDTLDIDEKDKPMETVIAVKCK